MSTETQSMAYIEISKNKVHYDVYKKLKYQLRIMLAKICFGMELQVANSKDSKIFFKYIKSKFANDNSMPLSMHLNEVDGNNNLDISNLFNEYFISVFNKGFY